MPSQRYTGGRDKQEEREISYICLCPSGRDHQVEQLGFIVVVEGELSPWGTMKRFSKRALEPFIGFRLLLGNFGRV